MKTYYAYNHETYVDGVELTRCIDCGEAELVAYYYKNTPLIPVCSACSEKRRDRDKFIEQRVIERLDKIIEFLSDSATVCHR